MAPTPTQRLMSMLDEDEEQDEGAYVAPSPDPSPQPNAMATQRLMSMLDEDEDEPAPSPGIEGGLSDEAALLVRFGLAEPSYAEEVVNQEGYGQFSAGFVSVADDIDRHIGEAKKINPNLDEDAVRSRLDSEARFNYFEPITDSSGKPVKNPPLDNAGRRVLIRSIEENIPFKQAVYEYYIDPTTVDQYVDDEKSIASARAKLLTQKQDLLVEFSGAQKFMGEAPKGEAEALIQAISPPGVDLSQWYGREDFSEIYRSGGRPTYADGAKAFVNSEIGKLAERGGEYGHIEDPIERLHEEAFIRRMDHHPPEDDGGLGWGLKIEMSSGAIKAWLADPEGVELPDEARIKGAFPSTGVRIAKEELGIKGDKPLTPKEIEMISEWATGFSGEPHGVRKRIEIAKLVAKGHDENDAERLGYTKGEFAHVELMVREEYSSLNPSFASSDFTNVPELRKVSSEEGLDEILEDMPIIGDLMLMREGIDAAMWVSANVAAGTMQDAIEAAGMSDEPWFVPQSVMAYGELRKELDERSVFEGIAAPFQTVVGSQPAPLVESAEFDRARKGALLEDAWEMDRKLGMLNSALVSSDREGKVEVTQDLDGRRIVRVIPTKPFKPKEPLGKGAEAIEYAKEDARIYKLSQPAEFIFLENEQLLVKDGQIIEPGTPLLKNVSTYGSGPMGALSSHSQLGGDVLTDQVGEWFDKSFKLRWDSELKSGEYVTANEDPFFVRTELGRGFWDRVEEDPVGLVANFARNVVETVGVLPAALIYLHNRIGQTAEEHPEVWEREHLFASVTPGFELAIETIGDIYDDASEMIPLAIDYMIEEASYPGRYFYNNPIDALFLSQVGASGLLKGFKAGEKFHRLGIVEARMMNAGIKFQRAPMGPGKYVGPGGQVMTQEALKTVARGESLTDPMVAKVSKKGPIGLDEATRILQKEVGEEVAFAFRTDPSFRRKFMRGGFRFGSQALEKAEQIMNPLILLRESSRMVGYGVDKVMGDVIRVEGWESQKALLHAYFKDPSKSFDMSMITPDGTELNILDFFAQRRGKMNWEADEVLKKSKAIPHEDLVELEGLLRREIEAGGQFFVRITDDMLQNMPGRGTVRKNPTDGDMRGGTLFSGVGMVEHGLADSGLNFTFGVELDPIIAAAHEAAHGKKIINAKVQDVDYTPYAGTEYIHASPVCTNASKAKINATIDTPLDMETAQATAKALEQIKPKYFTLENVERYRASEAMDTILSKLRQLGYTIDMDAKGLPGAVYDAADYGSPSKRKRFILRAKLADGPFPDVVPTHGPSAGAGTVHRGTIPYADWYSAIQDLVPTFKKSKLAPWQRKRLKANDVDIKNLEGPIIVAGGTLQGSKFHSVVGESAPVITASPNPYRLVVPQKPGKAPLVYDISSRGLARLMGVSDDFKLPETYGHAHTVIGNGIPPGLTKAVISPMLDVGRMSGDLNQVRKRIDGETAAREAGKASTPELRKAVESESYVLMHAAHNALIASRNTAHASLHEFQAALKGIQTRKPTPKELSNWKKNKKVPRGMPKDTVLTPDTDVVVVKRKGSEGYQEYLRYRKSVKENQKASKNYISATDKFTDAHAKFVKILPEESLPLARRRLPEVATAERIMSGGEPRIRIRDPNTMDVVDEFPTRGRTPEGLVERTRKDVERSIATGGGGTTLREMAKRMASNEQLAFIPANHISMASNYRLMQQLKRKIDDGSIPEKKLREDGTWEGISHSDIDEILEEMQMDHLSIDEVAYLEWVGKYMDVPNLQTATGVFASRLPGGLEDLYVQQLNRPGIAAAQIRTKLMNLGAQAVHMGLLAKDVYMSNIAVYFPHYYKKYAKEFGEEVSEDVEKAVLRGEFNKVEGIRGHRMMKERLRDLELDKKYELGLVEDARYTAAKGIIELTHDVEMARSFNLMSTSVYKNGPYKGRKLAIDGGQPRPFPGWELLPDSAKYGALRGKWVSPEMSFYLKRSIEVPGRGMRIYRRLLARWKFAMVPMNPASHVRNLVSAAVFGDMAGMNPIFSKSARAGWKGTFGEAWHGKGIWWERAMKDGILGTDLVSTEVRRELTKMVGDIPERKWDYSKTTEFEHALNMTDGILQWMDKGIRRHGKKLTRKLGEGLDNIGMVYRFEEELPKLVRYKQTWNLWEDMKRTGNVSSDAKRAFGKERAAKLATMTEEQMRGFARRDINKWFFDYSDVSQAVEWARLYWSPFITFQYKALPKLMHEIHANPARSFYYRRIFESLSFMTEWMDGTPPDPETLMERNLEYWSLPAYSRISSMRLPGTHTVKYQGRDPVKQHRWIDFQHFTPAGGLMVPTVDWDYGIVPDMLEPKNPIMSVALGPFFYNRSGFSPEDMSLVPKGLSGPYAALETKMREGVRNAAPPLAGLIAQPLMGYMYDALSRKFDWGEKYETAEGLAPSAARLIRGRATTKLLSAYHGRPYPDRPGGILNSMGDAGGDAAFGYRSMPVEIGGRKAIQAIYDRREGELKSVRNRKFKLYKGDQVEIAKAKETYYREIDRLKEWKARVYREAAVEAHIMGKTMGILNKDIPFRPDKNFRRDLLMNYLKSGRLKAEEQKLVEEYKKKK